ncbi:MAG: sulfatase, partial [Verrucomicrobia bacterium]
MNCQSHFYRGQDPKLVTRRWFFQQCGVGLGSIALGSLFRQNSWAASATLNSLASKQPHYAAKAKRVIYLFMAGAP